MRAGLIAATLLVALEAGDASLNASIAQTPWQAGETAADQSAAASLEKLLLARGRTERGVHVETLMTMAGAVAGYAAQHAIWETVIKPGPNPKTAHARGRDAMVTATTPNGETYYFGDLLNSYLIPQDHPLSPGNRTLWTFLSAAVREAGGIPLSQPQVEDIFRHTSETIGTPRFGQPRLAETKRSSLTPREALIKLWPEVSVLLARPLADGRVLAVERWPTIAAVTAQRLVTMAKGTLDPAISMRIVMEAAVPMSKVDLRALAKSDTAIAPPAPPLPSLLSVDGTTFVEVERGRKSDGQNFLEYRPTTRGETDDRRMLAFSHYPGSGGDISAGVKLMVDVVRKNLAPPKINIIENPQTGEVILDWIGGPNANEEFVLSLVRYGLSEDRKELISVYWQRTWRAGTRDPADVAAERRKVLADLAKLDLTPARRHFAEIAGKR